jgi:hypothetical protein
MFRKLCCALVVLCFLAVSVLAAEFTGTVEKINTKNGDITIKVKDKSMDFTIPPVAKVTDKGGKALKGRKRLAGITKGSEVTITTEKKKDKEVVTEVKVK